MQYALHFIKLESLIFIFTFTQKYIIQKRRKTKNCCKTWKWTLSSHLSNTPSSTWQSLRDVFPPYPPLQYSSPTSSLSLHSSLSSLLVSPFLPRVSFSRERAWESRGCTHTQHSWWTREFARALHSSRLLSHSLSVAVPRRASRKSAGERARVRAANGARGWKLIGGWEHARGAEDERKRRDVRGDDELRGREKRWLEGSFLGVRWGMGRSYDCGVG